MLKRYFSLVTELSGTLGIREVFSVRAGAENFCSKKMKICSLRFLVCCKQEFRHDTYMSLCIDVMLVGRSWFSITRKQIVHLLILLQLC